MLGACGGSNTTTAPDGALVDGAAPSFEERSGTRLKRRGHEVDGTKLLASIFDVMRGELCRPVPWRDGQTYCAPAQQTGSVVYADAACTQTIGLASATDCDGPARYFVEHEVDTCSSVASHLYVAGDVLAATTYYIRSETSCIPSSVFAPYEVLRRLGPEVPVSDLVPLAISEPVGEHRLRQRFYESADGLRFAATLHDAVLDESCSLFGQSSLSCLPHNTLDASMFGEASCTRHVAVKYSTCTAPRFAIHPQQAFCAFPSYELFRVGEEVAAPMMYRSTSASTCVSTDIGDRPVFELGEPVEMSTATPVYTGTSPRVQATYAASSEGDAFPLRTFFDHGKQTTCVVDRAEDNTLRCLPHAASVLHYFRDAACTNAIEVLRVYRGPQGCAAVTKPAFARDVLGNLDPCTAQQRIRAVGEPYAGPLFQSSDSCDPVSLTNATFFEVGATVPPAEFALAQVITE